MSYSTLFHRFVIHSPQSLSTVYTLHRMFELSPACIDIRKAQEFDILDFMPTILFSKTFPLYTTGSDLHSQGVERFSESRINSKSAVGRLDKATLVADDGF